MTHEVAELRVLTGLRFYAALHVVLFHNAGVVALPGHAPFWYRNIIVHGDAAVSFFFVLSGFILTYVYCTPEGQLKESAATFWKTRFARLYPLYLVGFLLDVPRGLAVFLEESTLVKALVSALATLGMVQSWHPRVSAAWNAPAWSLSCEAFFYLLFPFVAKWLGSMKRSRLLPLYWAFYLFPIACYGVASLVGWNSADPSAGELFWRSFPILRLGEFLQGAIVGRLFLEQRVGVLGKSRVRNLAFWGGCGLSLFLVAVVPLPRVLLANYVCGPLFAVVIVSAASGPIRGGSLFTHRGVHLLGLASYGLYILHQPIKAHFATLTQSWEISAELAFLLYLLLVLGLSLVAHRFIENPSKGAIVRALGVGPRT